ncbi:MAG: noncanonical pyrimidine nucleotidase, YjjG family [Provencibacterium sp.]|jgi:2-haloacid dehalogenase|nr:noncanonical pyrimidine nucleotidase, YjjG family [Provencibacterium sp.]
MGFTTVLLDADGTLFDFHTAQRQALENTLRAYSLPFSEQTLKIYESINEGLWRRLERGEITKKQLLSSRFRLFFERLGVSADGGRFNEDYLSALAEGVFLLPGALELCRRLHEHRRLYLATNGVEYVQKKRLRLSALAPYIDGIFISEQLGYAKPDARFFDEAFARLGNPDRKGAILLGDSLSSDMLGAFQAGIAGCWYCPDENRQPQGVMPDYRIRHLEEFLPIVLGE